MGKNMENMQNKFFIPKNARSPQIRKFVSLTK